MWMVLSGDVDGFIGGCGWLCQRFFKNSILYPVGITEFFV
jgi:hypothetical protein